MSTETNLNIPGTINPSFQVGPSGPTIYQGIGTPSSGSGVAGDIYIDVNGSSSSFYQKQGSTWYPTPAGPTSATVANDIVIFSNTTGNGLADSGIPYSHVILTTSSLG